MFQFRFSNVRISFQYVQSRFKNSESHFGHVDIPIEHRERTSRMLENGSKKGVNIGFKERREGSRENVETLRERFERQRQGVRIEAREKASSKET